MKDRHYNNIRLLNPKDFNIYNSLTFIIAYARRITIFISIYKLRKIFAILPLYIKGEVLNWYNSLNNTIYAILLKSIKV